MPIGWNAALNDLINLLAGLYSDRDKARFVVRRSGLDPDGIDFAGAPRIYWMRIVEEANRWGAGVMAHAEGNAGIKSALRAGVTSIEHGNVLDQEAIDLFLAKGVFLVPTLHIAKVVAERRDTAGLSEASKRKEERLVESGKGCFRRACEAGVKVALGTDAFIADMHGTNAAELPLMMEEGGLSAMEAIVAGTKNAAGCCLLGDRIGTLEAGKLADALLVDGDPLADITVLQDPERITVYKEGDPVL